MELQNFSIPAGDTDTVTFEVVPDTGIDILLSGLHVTWKVYDQEHGVVDDDAVAIISRSLGAGIEIVPSPPGFVVTIEGSDTLALLGNYYFEAQVIDALEAVTTVTQGIMTVTEAH